MNKQTALNLLGLNANATPQEIKKAYQRAASVHHPDKGGDETKFKEVKAAYELLTSKQPEKPEFFYRQTDGFDFSNIFDKAFSGAFGEQFAERNVRTTAYSLTVPISLQEAYDGCVKKVQLKCFKNDQVRDIVIPAGVFHGQQLKIISDKTPEGLDATVTIVISVKLPNGCRVEWPNSLMTSSPGDVFDVLVVSPFVMMTGGWIEYTTLDGATLQLRIPEGMQPGKQLKIKERGYWKFASRSSGSRGNVYIEIIPKIEKISDLNRDELFPFLRTLFKEMHTNSPENFKRLMDELFLIKENEKTKSDSDTEF